MPGPSAGALGGSLPPPQGIPRLATNAADRLKKLADNGVLHPTLADRARKVRLVGNAGAHFDLSD